MVKPINTLCAVADCNDSRVPGTSWCQEHGAKFRTLGKSDPALTPVRVPSYLPTQRPTTPATVPAAPPAKANGIMPKERRTTCIEPGCTEPCRPPKNGNTFARCEEHQRAFWRDTAERQRREKGATNVRGRRPAQSDPRPTPAQNAAVDRVAASFGDAVPEPEPRPAPRPIPAAVAPIAETDTPEPVTAVLEAATGGMARPLRQLILDALVDGDDVQFSVSGIEIQFTGKIRL